MDNKNYALMEKLWSKGQRTSTENKLLGRLIQWYIAEMVLDKIDKTTDGLYKALND